MSDRLPPLSKPFIVRALDAAFFLAARVPLTGLHRLGAVVGRLAGALPGRFGERLRSNLLHAFPDADAETVREAARAAGRMAVEVPYWWSNADPAEAARRTETSAWPLIDRLLGQGRGVIVLTPHWGGFEVLGQFIANRHPLTVLFKPPHDVRLHAWVAAKRARPNLATAPASMAGVRQLVKTLKRGGAVGILPDQVPSAGDGVWAPFFGRPAYTMTLVQRLQQLTGCALVVMGMERLPEGRYGAHARVLETALPDEPVAAAAAINRAMEDIIRIAPAQYLWGYNRYKNPGVPGPDEAGGSAGVSFRAPHEQQ